MPLIATVLQASPYMKDTVLDDPMREILQRGQLMIGGKRKIYRFLWLEKPTLAWDYNSDKSYRTHDTQKC